VIQHVRGVCHSLNGLDAIIEVGGVGLAVSCTPAARANLQVGAPAHVATALVVREDGWTLFGFADDSERELFAALQTVTGVGPKMAATAIGALGAGDLSRALHQADAATLVRIPGVGKKVADRMILELRDKVFPIAGDDAPATPELSASEPEWRAAVVGGLESLGWQRRDAEKAADTVAEAIAQDTASAANIPALLRMALASLDRV